MSFNDLWSEYRQRFSVSGSFELRRNDNLRDTLHRNGVPFEWGVYLIYCDGIKECLYIGKGGGPNQQRQSFTERLTKGKRSKNMKLHVWFQELMVRYNVDRLRFEWVSTERLKVDPIGIRDALIREHEATFGRPPLENDQR